ncbi:MAG TPA: aldo/keto reductase [Acidimicrobiales bacterium]|nr:MAG: aldo/keto reductase [Actinobacteria bacterium 21-73-9]HQU26221.1 aldo/keto reductase [Acidimicrobiales bacterium]
MDERLIGSLRVSVVGIGCNNFGRRLDQAATDAVVHAALEAGVTLFDTADTYGDTLSEVMLGRALAGRRDEAVVATKFGMPIDDERYGAAPDYVRRACEDSLARLRTDRIDLYQLHFPDETVPIADTLGALAELVAEGKVREVGCSNFSAAQLREAAAAAGSGPAFASVQNQYSLLERSPERDGVLEACDELGVAFLPFYPLANGLLSGKVRPGAPLPEGSRLATMPAERAVHWHSPELMARVGALLELAEGEGVSLLSLAFSWLLDHPEVASVIAGASNPEQVRANAAAATALTSALRAALDTVTAGH